MKNDIEYDIPFNKPFIAGRELYFIAQAVFKAHLSGGGYFTRKCHRWMERRLGCKAALLTNSCTAALEMAAILCEIMPGDEIIMPSFTFVSTANAFVLRGGVPVFVDIRPDSLNIDENRIESAITKKTKAIVPVHYAGTACAMDQILSLSRHHDLWVVEDAAQAFLSKYRNRYLGTIGHLGCVSYHETKNVISGEGGAILINDERLVQRAEIIWDKGTDRKRFFRGEVDQYTWLDIGSSYLPGELTAAFLYAQLEQSDKLIEKRTRLFGYYLELLKPLEQKGFIRLPTVNDFSPSNGHIFYILAKCRSDRDRLIQFLGERKICAIFHYVPLHSSPAGSRFCRAVGKMEVTDDICGRLLRLPLYYEMTENEVNQVADAVFDYFLTRS